MCLGIKLVSKVTTEINLCDVYATEFINYGIIHGSSFSNGGRYHLGRHKSEVCCSILIVFWVYVSKFYSFNTVIMLFEARFSHSYRCTAFQCTVSKDVRLSHLYGFWLFIHLVTRICKLVKCGWIELMML